MARGGTLSKYWSERRGAFVYEIRYRTEDGKSRRRSLGTTDPKAAQMRLDEWLAADGRMPINAAALPHLDMLALFLRDLSTELRPGTIRYYDAKLRDLFERFAAVPMSRWTPDMIRTWLIDEKSGWAPRTLRGLVQAVGRFRAWAAEHRGLDIPDFVRGIKAQRQHKSVPAHHSAAEFGALLEAVSGHALEPLIVMAGLAGMRVGEMERAAWGDFRWDVDELIIHGVKTHEDRVNPIDPRLRQRLQPMAGPDGDRVLSDSVNSSARRWLAALCTDAGVPVLSWHGLRHTYATSMLAAGVDIVTIGALLGHAPGSPITLRYLHTSAALKRAAVEKATGAAGGAHARLRALP